LPYLYLPIVGVITHIESFEYVGVLILLGMGIYDAAYSSYMAWKDIDRLRAESAQRIYESPVLPTFEYQRRDDLVWLELPIWVWWNRFLMPIGLVSMIALVFWLLGHPEIFASN